MPRFGKEKHRTQQLEAELLELEKALLEPSVRGSKTKLDDCFHPDFIEFGSSGRVYDKQTMLEMLDGENSGSGGVVLRDFEVRPLGEDSALVTYRSIGAGGQEARRSSIWSKSETKWQIVFHQGTRIPDSWGTVR